MNIVIFTDLDGTFLDHFTYSYKDLLPCFTVIRQNNVPIVFVTSKTRAEVKLLVAELDYDVIFSVENGAAVFFPEKLKLYDKVFGKKLDEIKGFFDCHKDKFFLRSIFDIQEEYLSKKVNMDISRVGLLKQREFSLPFFAENLHELNKFIQICEDNGYKILKGGRFYHLVGKSQDKGVAVRYIKGILNGNLKSIGLGDSGNDYDMLINVDYPVVIKKYDGSYDEKLLTIKNAIKSRFIGPEGWCEVVMNFLKEEGNG